MLTIASARLVAKRAARLLAILAAKFRFKMWARTLPATVQTAAETFRRDNVETVSARSLMDRASDYGSEGWKFESSRARHKVLIVLLMCESPESC